MNTARQIVVRGGAVVVSAPDGEALAQADMRIEGTRIVAVGPGLGTADAEMIDARGCIVMPGMVNAHSHSYAPMLRGTVACEPLDLFVLEAMARRGRRASRTPPQRCTPASSRSTATPARAELTLPMERTR